MWNHRKVQSTRNYLYQNAIAKPLLENKWEFLPFVSFWCNNNSRKIERSANCEEKSSLSHIGIARLMIYENVMSLATKSLDRKKYVLKRVPVLVIKVSSDKYWFLPKHTLKGMDDVSDRHVLLRSMDGSCQVYSPVMRSWKIISEFILSNSNLQPHYIPNQWNCKKESLPNTQVNTNKMR